MLLLLTLHLNKLDVIDGTTGQVLTFYVRNVLPYHLFLNEYFIDVLTKATYNLNAKKCIMLIQQLACANLLAFSVYQHVFVMLSIGTMQTM